MSACGFVMVSAGSCRLLRLEGLRALALVVEADEPPARGAGFLQLPAMTAPSGSDASGLLGHCTGQRHTYTYN